MNKIFTHASLLLAAVMGLASCQKTSLYDAPDADRPDTMAKVSFNNINSATRAAEDDDEVIESVAFDNEKSITKLTVVVFVDGKIHHVIKDDAIEYTNPTKKSDGGFFSLSTDLNGAQLEFIANADTNLEAKLTVGTTLANYKKIVVEKTVPVHGSSDFVMTNAEPLFYTNPSYSSNYQIGSIAMRRLAARIDVYNLVTGLNLTKITLKQQQRKSYMTAQSGNAAPTGAIADKVFNPEPNSWFTADKAVAGIYTYEQPAANATKIEIEATYNAKPVKLTVDFKKKDNTTKLDILRNHLYRVVLQSNPGPYDPSKPSAAFIYNIEVLDWDDNVAAFNIEDNVFENLISSSSSSSSIKTPLDYFAEYNMASLDKEFEMSHNPVLPPLFKWNDAVSSYPSTGTLINGKTWYLPTVKELRSVFTHGEIKFNVTTEDDINTSLVSFGGKDYTMTGRRNTVGGVTYLALKYDHATDPDQYFFASYLYVQNAFGSGMSALKVQMKGGYTSLPDIDAATISEFNDSSKTVRFFPGYGFLFPAGSSNGDRLSGNYWSCDQVNSEKAYTANFASLSMRGRDNYWTKDYGFCIRLVTRD